MSSQQRAVEAGQRAGQRWGRTKKTRKVRYASKEKAAVQTERKAHELKVDGEVK